MSAAARDKGKRGELECVNLFKRCGGGNRSKRTAPIQAGCGTSGFADAMLELPDGEYMKVECKYRESLPEWPWEWLRGVDVLALRKSRHDWLGVVDLASYFEMRCELARLQSKDAQQD